MSLKIEDLKPGDILKYSDWYAMIIQHSRGDNAQLDFLWISGNSNPAYYDTESFRLPSDFIGIKEICNKGKKLTHLDVHTLIQELDKL